MVRPSARLTLFWPVPDSILAEGPQPYIDIITKEAVSLNSNSSRVFSKNTKESNPEFLNSFIWLVLDDTKNLFTIVLMINISKKCKEKVLWNFFSSCCKEILAFY